MEEEDKKLNFFGRDLSKIPCFRSSWLYGISGGIGTGLLYFLFTSKPRIASHVGFSAMVGITMSYWFVCRYEWSRRVLELQKMQDYVEKRVLIDGTEMEKLYEAEVANVGHSTQKNV
ncbi:cytochrome c oxidase assembly protein COX20, mitochondrial [Homalodisca vitripennis]|uniref:cytochrome c oxidase assembly protein COX20, mitochondrial n=1 Tax=Homalodisca vitripennis TaxID=197043 RepID=UPI001EE9E014|nr:cytochrome c oxidase assembly protein COX20, mitochondrial [Homalodisca vitripennis]